MAVVVKERKKSPAAEAFKAGAMALGIALCIAIALLAFMGVLWLNTQLAELVSENRGIRFTTYVLLGALEIGAAIAIVVAVKAYREARDA